MENRILSIDPALGMASAMTLSRTGVILQQTQCGVSAFRQTSLPQGECFETDNAFFVIGAGFEDTDHDVDAGCVEQKVLFHHLLHRHGYADSTDVLVALPLSILSKDGKKVVSSLGAGVTAYPSMVSLDVPAPSGILRGVAIAFDQLADEHLSVASTDRGYQILSVSPYFAEFVVINSFPSVDPRSMVVPVSLSAVVGAINAHLHDVYGVSTGLAPAAFLQQALRTRSVQYRGARIDIEKYLHKSLSDYVALVVNHVSDRLDKSMPVLVHSNNPDLVMLLCAAFPNDVQVVPVEDPLWSVPRGMAKLFRKNKGWV